MGVKLGEFLQNLRKHATYDREMREADERFRDKFIVEQFATFKKVLSPSLLFFSAFSVVTGFFFVSSLIEQAVGYFVLAAVLASLLLVIWETLKHFLSHTAFTYYFKFGSGGMFLLVPAVLIYAGSVFFSLKGAAEMHARVDDTVAEFDRMTAVSLDSLTAAYDSVLADIRRESAEYKAEVSWRGHIDLSNSTNRQILANFDQRLKAAEDDKRAALRVLTQKRETARNEVLADSGFNLWVWIALSGGNELMILAGLLFIAWYQHRVSQETDFVTATADLPSTDLPTLLQMLARIAKNATDGNGQHVDLSFGGASASRPGVQPDQPVGFAFDKENPDQKEDVPSGEKPSDDSDRPPQNPEKDDAMRSDEMREKSEPKPGKIQSCKHCGADYERRTTWQKYCSEACRIAAYEKRTGRKLKKKKPKDGK